MIQPIRACFLVVLCLLATSIARADVALTPEERENLGIQTVPVKPIDTARRWFASAHVLDPTSLITTLGELQAAETAAAASQAEAERSARLYREETNIARKALDAARAQAITDAAKVNATRAQLIGSWGYGVAALSKAARSALVADLLAGRASLARVDLVQSLPTPVTAPKVEVRSLVGGKQIAAEWLGQLPQGASSTLAGAGLLRVSAPLTAGALLETVLSEPSSSIKGMSVPSSAVVRWHGGEWVYEETSPNHFARRAVRSGLRVEGRALLAENKGSAGNVVTVGARALLAAELGASSPEEEQQEDD
ncbi:MAG TPA: hypothetical protein VG994_15340 [Steroidobacteraceae bacterium]|nr:hypothetical protein [Steroidobacteraceae bacterium]